MFQNFLQNVLKIFAFLPLKSFGKKSFHTKPKFFCGFVENSKQSITKLKYPFREKEKSLHQYRISKIGKIQKKLKNHYLHI